MKSGPENTNVPLRLFFCLFICFALHLALRAAVSETLQLDEAEQIFLTQEFRLGYGSQPPLYTWLQAGVFVLVGKGVPGLALLKSLLLFRTCGIPPEE